MFLFFSGFLFRISLLLSGGVWATSSLVFLARLLSLGFEQANLEGFEQGFEDFLRKLGVAPGSSLAIFKFDLVCR